MTWFWPHVDMTLPYMAKINIFENFCGYAPILDNHITSIRIIFESKLIEKIAKYSPRGKSFWWSPTPEMHFKFYSGVTLEGLQVLWTLWTLWKAFQSRTHFADGVTPSPAIQGSGWGSGSGRSHHKEPYRLLEGKSPHEIGTHMGPIAPRHIWKRTSGSHSQSGHITHSCSLFQSLHQLHASAKMAWDLNICKAL
jgi:hypothetical protein